MVNIPHINLIIADIRREPQAFDMAKLRPASRRTPGCIAGFVMARTKVTYWQNAGRWLGINARQAHDLFGLDECRDDLAKITPSEAIATLERLRDTGAVAWGEAKSP